METKSKSIALKVNMKEIKSLEDHCQDKGIDDKHWKYKALFGYFGFIRGKEVSKEAFEGALHKVVFGRIG